MESFLFALNLLIVIGCCWLALEKDNKEQKKEIKKESKDA